LLLQVWTVDKELKGWSAAQKKFFDAGQVRLRDDWVWQNADTAQQHLPWRAQQQGSLHERTWHELLMCGADRK
jgi:hypothetical protein